MSGKTNNKHTSRTSRCKSHPYASMHSEKHGGNRPLSSKSSVDVWPSRTGEILKDELALYTESYFYDCTFEVAFQTTSKVFKCHKLILARASVPFATMLYGDFSESSKDKDDPIQITSVEANAFDIAMRYIYGGETDFQDVPTACKVYRFAHEWLLNSLMTAASEFLKNPSPDDVITVHEMYKTFNDHSHSEKLLSIIAANTSAVLKSAAWLKSTSSTVLEIFKMEYLKVGSEEELFEALFAWGSADGNTD
ncbi:BTB/POZ domain-containing protein 6-like isoform X3 [Neocloeon triangulifer]|uniref:BTB/POZ domain-containing protein 6-like isoform X3 n=1 Tax=Neocloeon triangulifer TaxID=2078957 RepID=UPI00286F1149|nr:BTB/POZ domain-containing protein 6-like isoform X3 [Neocloeon triangulifer]